MAHQSRDNKEIREYDIKDFRRMTGAYTAVDSKEKIHRLIQNFTPMYAEIVTNSEDGSYYKKAQEPYPLVLSRDVASTYASANLDGYPASMVFTLVLGNMLMVTSNFHVYVIDGTAAWTDVGQPTAVSSNDKADIAIFNGKVVTAHATIASAYYGTIQAATAFSTIAHGLGAPADGLPFFLEPMGASLYMSGANSANNDSRLVKIINSAFAISSGLDLGGTWTIAAMKNTNDKFLALMAYSAGTQSSQLENFRTFFWDGNASNNYFDAAVISGVFGGWAIKDGVLYTFMQKGNDIYAYYLDNFRWVPAGRMRELTILNTVVGSAFSNPRNKIATFHNYFIIITTKGMLFWDLETGESALVYHDPTNNVKLVAAISVLNSPDNSVSKYRFYMAKGTIQNVHNWYPANAGPKVVSGSANATYDSNYLSFEEITGGEFERGIIDSVEIICNVAPPTSGDSVQVTLTVHDDLENDTYTQYQVIFKNTVANSTNTGSMAVGSIVIDNTRLIMRNIGAACQKFNINIVVGVTTTGWDLIIKEITIHYKSGLRETQ